MFFKLANCDFCRDLPSLVCLDRSDTSGIFETWNSGLRLRSLDLLGNWFFLRFIDLLLICKDVLRNLFVASLPSSGCKFPPDEGWNTPDFVFGSICAFFSGLIILKRPPDAASIFFVDLVPFYCSLAS